MTNVIEIEGHKAAVTFDPHIKLFRGKFTSLSGAPEFYARNMDRLRREGALSLQVFDAYARDGIDPLSRAMGAMVLRVSPELHRAAAAAAKAAGKSLDQWATEVLLDATHA